MRNLDLECLRDKPVTQTGDHDHEVYGNNPGQNKEWDGDKQCQMLTFSSGARLDHTMADMENICYSLKCRVPGIAYSINKCLYPGVEICTEYLHVLCIGYITHTL